MLHSRHLPHNLPPQRVFDGDKLSLGDVLERGAMVEAVRLPSLYVSVIVFHTARVLVG